MWTMMDSNNDHGRDQLKPPPDLVIRRKLRPLMPRPISSCTAAANHPYSSPSCCCTRNPKSLSWNHPMGPPLVSTRWNPTPEQLQALEEMYRRGIRTPSAEQIQQIAAKLGRFGKIEGKNVFYWFQNHKARERQKKRRQLELLAGKKMQHDTKQTGLGRRYFENEYHKKVSIPSNCGTPSEDSASMPGAVIAAECGKDGWPQLNHKELQHKLATAENEACWQLDLSSCLPPPPHPNNNSSINAITAHKATGQENTYSYASLNPITVFPNGSQNQNENEENQTLQLFPTGKAIQQDSRYSNFTTRTKITPSEFIEFLPIKN